MIAHKLLAMLETGQAFVYLFFAMMQTSFIIYEAGHISAYGELYS